MPSVQFYGIDDVMEAAENRKCGCWGIWINGKLFSKYESIDFDESMQILLQNLESLGKSSSGIYTLKFFESDKTAIKINEKTVCDGGSFNFKLVEPEERQQRAIGWAEQQQTKHLETRIEKLEKEKAALLQEEPETIGTVIRDLVRQPDQLAQLVNIGRALFGLPVQNIPMGAIGSTRIGQTETAHPVQVVHSDEDLQRIGDAIEVMGTQDPRIVEHMEKLARMAKENPTQFQATVAMLDLKP